MLSIKDIKPGESCIVKLINNQGVLKRRLIDMGITPGVVVNVVKKAPLGDPIQINLRGYELTIRKSEAKNIVVERKKV